MAETLLADAEGHVVGDASNVRACQDGGAPGVRLVNLTPHEVTILGMDGGPGVVLAGSGSVPRLVLSPGTTTIVTVAGEPGPGAAAGTVRIAVDHGQRLVGIDPPLPDPQPGVLYVTSRVVAEHAPERTDLVWPNDLVRDSQERPVGARGLAALHPPTAATLSPVQ